MKDCQLNGVLWAAVTGERAGGAVRGAVAQLPLELHHTVHPLHAVDTGLRHLARHQVREGHTCWHISSFSSRAV